MDWPLFFSAFASATLLPGGSELLLLYRLQSGGDPLLLLFSATSGNLLGSFLTYGMGRGGRWLLRYRPSEEPALLARAQRWFDRGGVGVLLLAWLPIIGDPLCLLAGVLRVAWPLFLLLVGIGKAARYGVVVGLFAVA